MSAWKSALDLAVQGNLASIHKAKRHALYRQYAESGRFFRVEYSSSSRSKCRACKRMIVKGEIRFRHIVCGQKCCKRKGGPDTCGRWHVQCLVETQDEHPEWFLYTNPDWRPIRSLDQVLGNETLDPKDRQVLAEQLKHGLRESDIKKRP